MKKLMAVSIFFALASGHSALALTFNTDQLVLATQTALSEFSKNNSSHGVHLTGFKTWISGDDAKVKIYVNHDGMNMDFNYLCQIQQNAVICTTL